MNDTTTKNQDEVNYDVAFIDPEDLVDFISENTESSPDEEVVTPEDIYLQEEEPSLKYTEKLKESSSDYVIKKREDIKGRLALIYTIFTFIIFLLVILVAVIDGIVRKTSIIDNLNTLLPLVSGIFLGSLGFVLGYYFKKEDDK